MENRRKRALELADVIASSILPWSKEVREAEQELTELLKKVDSQTQKQVMERIRGYS
jgi:hypothetical protein